MLVVWDLYSGQRDRVFLGSHAKQMLECLSDNIQSHASMSQPFVGAIQVQEGGRARVTTIEHNSTEQVIKLLPGPRRDIGILDIDITGILESPSGVSPSVWFSTSANNSHEKVTVELLTTALLSVHVWGMDRQLDSSLCAMLGELGLRSNALNGQEKSGNLPCSVSTSAVGTSLTQGVVVSDTGALTIQMPPALNFTNRVIAEARNTNRNLCPPKEETGPRLMSNDVAPGMQLLDFVGEDTLGQLWCTVPEFVGTQLLCIIALAKKLMHEGLNQVVATACSSIVKLYAIQFLDIAPVASIPALGVLVGLWEAKNHILKETARVLLASTVEPEKLLDGIGISDNAHRVKAGVEEVQSVIALWEAIQTGGSVDDAQNHAHEV